MIDFDPDGPPLFALRRCVIYANPDCVAISDVADFEPTIRIQHVPGAHWTLGISNCRFEGVESMPPGQVRIRPMLPSEIAEHDALIASEGG